jgi:hypothetical protein
MRPFGCCAVSAHQCAFEGVETEGCKSLYGFDLDPLTESNCVPAKGGGEQLKVNFQSVG